MTTPGLFQQAQEEQARRVYDLSGDATFIGYSGRGRDAEVQPVTGLLAVAAKVNFADVCPDDALDHTGATRALERFPRESDDAYRGRQVVAFDTWEYSGTAQGITSSLESYMSALGSTAPDALVLEDWQSAFADDSEGVAYSRFVTVLRGTPWTPALLGTMTLGTVLGSTATPEEVRATKLQVRKWKDAHALPILVRVALADVDLLGVDFALGTSILANDEDANDWIMMRRLGVDFELGTTLLDTYEI